MTSAKENFYEHVNEKWLQDPDNAIPSDYSSWGGFVKLHDTSLVNQIDLVKKIDVTKFSEHDDEYKVKCLDRASQKRFESWKENTANLSPIISELEHFNRIIHVDGEDCDQDRNYIKKLAEYVHYSDVNGIENVMDFDKGSNLDNVNEVLLDFSVGGLSLPSREYYKTSELKEKYELFSKHLENVKRILNSEELSDTFVEDVLKFENLLADYSMMQSQSREYDSYYTLTDLTGLYTDLNELKSLEGKEENYSEEERNFKLSDEKLETCKEFFEELYKLYNFREVLEANHKKNGLDTNDSPFRLTAFDGDGIRRVLNLLLDENNMQIYKSYMHYKIISAFKSFATKELDDEYFDFYSRKLGGQQEQKPEEKRTMGLINAYAGEMMGKIYIKEYFPEESKEGMKTLVNSVLGIMKVSLETNDWLTQETKEKALEKLGVFRTKIGYPDSAGWKDYSKLVLDYDSDLYTISKKYKAWGLRVNFLDKLNSKLDREEWHMTPQTVNAYFSPTQNEIVFPAAILQPPFYHASSETIDFDTTEENDCPENLRVLSANYGGIGAVIAHEITHGYDDKGRKFDGNGNLNDWWNSSDAELFKQKTELMVKSVEKYAFFSANEDVHKMDAQLTMGENLADLGGLSLSLKALQNVLNKEGVEGEEYRCCLRVFFKSWANVWKQNITEDKRVMLLKVDPHAPTDFRGNMVQHIAEFYTSFDVKEGDGMWLPPDERMKMW
jgi:predicted metalloendopeptidase